MGWDMKEEPVVGEQEEEVGEIAKMTCRRGKGTSPVERAGQFDILPMRKLFKRPKQQNNPQRHNP